MGSGALARAREGARSQDRAASRSSREVITDALLERHALLEQAVDSALRQAAGGDIRALNALTRLLDQAYGKPTEQAPELGGGEDDLPPMTREQRAKIMARLEAELAEVEGEEGAGDATENWPTG